jgi:hypothetical protein
MVCNETTPFSFQNSKPKFVIQNKILLTVSILHEILIEF